MFSCKRLFSVVRDSFSSNSVISIHDEPSGRCRTSACIDVITVKQITIHDCMYYTGNNIMHNVIIMYLEVLLPKAAQCSAVEIYSLYGEGRKTCDQHTWSYFEQ